MTNSSNGGSLFSSFTSLFSGLGGSSSSSSGANSGGGSGSSRRRGENSAGGGGRGGDSSYYNEGRFTNGGGGGSFGLGIGQDRPGSGDDWTLPYTHYGGGPQAGGMSFNGFAGAQPGTPTGGAYPPSRPAQTAGAGPYQQAVGNASLAEFTNLNNPNASTSNLVPPSMSSSAFGRRGFSFVGGLQQGSAGAPTLPGGGGAAGNVSSNMPSSAYPPLRHTWRRIGKWCNKQYPELWDTVNYPALESDLDDYEMRIGTPLPAAVRDSFLLHNGQELESYSNSTGGGSCSDGLFFGMPMLSVEQSMQEWTFWRSVDDDPETGASEEVKANMTACPDGWIRTDYSNRGWIPLITDRVGNYIGIDLNPPSLDAHLGGGNRDEEDDDEQGGYADGYDDEEDDDSLAQKMANGSLVEGDTSTASETPLDPIGGGAGSSRKGKKRGGAKAKISSSSARRRSNGAAPGGTPGQVIVFGRDFDTKVVLWRGEGEGGWGRFLQHFAEELEAGEMWTLDNESAGSDSEEDNIGYESYFGGSGGGGGQGGGDRAGDGAAGFKLHGDYKGWPVLEAWADRSIRAWEQAGFQVGVPLSQTPGYATYPSYPSGGGFSNGDEQGSDEQQNAAFYHQEQQQQRQQQAPELQIHPSEDEQPAQALVDPYPLADASTPTGAPKSHPLEQTLSEETISASSHQTATGSAPPSAAVAALAAGEPEPSTPKLNVVQRPGDSLSPPPASFKAAAKQRQDLLPATSAAQKRKPPPPAPSAALDLPTLADVQAAHAAALAEADRGSSHQFAFELKSGPSNSAHHSFDLEQRSSAEGRYSTGSGAGFFGGRRSLNNSGGSTSALRDVVVDPASVSPRPSASAERGGQFPGLSSFGGSDQQQGRHLTSAPGTPQLANGNDSITALIDAGSLPGSPAQRPKALDSVGVSKHRAVESPQPSPLLLQSFPSGPPPSG